MLPQLAYDSLSPCDLIKLNVSVAFTLFNVNLIQFAVNQATLNTALTMIQTQLIKYLTEDRAVMRPTLQPIGNSVSECEEQLPSVYSWNTRYVIRGAYSSQGSKFCDFVDER